MLMMLLMKITLDIKIMYKSKFNKELNLSNPESFNEKLEKMFLTDYKLKTALTAYGIVEEVPHRALKDARLIARLANKVNKFQDFIAKK